MWKHKTWDRNNDGIIPMGAVCLTCKNKFGDHYGSREDNIWCPKDRAKFNAYLDRKRDAEKAKVLLDAVPFGSWKNAKYPYRRTEKKGEESASRLPPMAATCLNCGNPFGIHSFDKCPSAQNKKEWTPGFKKLDRVYDPTYDTPGPRTPQMKPLKIKPPKFSMPKGCLAPRRFSGRF